VSDGVRANLIRQFRVPPGKVRTIVNPYDLPAIRQAGAGQPGFALPEDFCICVGRLVEAKDVGKVITAFAAERPTRDLLILGDGPLRSKLGALSQALGIENHVHFLGFLDDPFPIVSRARFLVSASRNEGFPNAAAEAMALGVPVILTDCPSGPAELLHGGRFGILVPLDDDGAFRQALRLIRDPQERATLSRLARTRIEAFAAPEIARAYWREFLRDEEIER
jgi:glycosyltransferase involved in cell wall biosynthesis